MAHGIPKGWRELELRDFLTFTPRPVPKPNKKYLSLGIRSHCKGTFIREVESPEKVMMDTLYAVKKDDLIVNITFAWEGAVALVNKSDEGALVSHRFPTYVFNRDLVLPDYFRYLIPSKRFTYNLGIVSPGGAGRNRVLDREDFLGLQFIFPPLREQNKICEILSRWDLEITTINRLIEAQKELKKGFLQKLFNGKIRLKEFGPPIKNISTPPVGWDHIYLNDAVKVIFSTVDKKIYPNQKTVRLCNYTDVYYNRYITNNLELMTSTADLNEIRKFKLVKGDVVITKDSETPNDIGVPAVIAEELDNVVCGYHLAILRPNSEFDSIFLAQQLLTHGVRKQFYRYSNGATRFGLGTEEVKKIIVLKPPIREQQRIAEIVRASDNAVAMLQAKQKALVAQKNGLMQKLLTGKISVKL